jgi:hypothetical protein
MNYAGKMLVIDDTVGHFAFVLGDKHFEAFGEDIELELRKLMGREIVLTVPDTGDERVDWLNNNPDHQWIEELRQVGPDRYEIWLGS